MATTKKRNIIIPKEAGILTIYEIKQFGIINLDAGQIDDQNCYSNASYDFRMGDEYYVPNKLNKHIKEAESYLECPHKSGKNKTEISYCRDENNVLRIKPFTSIVFSTYEKIKVPNNVAGRFDLRIQWALQGLILQVGTQIEPGYEGRLFGLLHNFSKKEICIPTTSRILTAEFSYTSKEAPPIIKNNKLKEPINSLEKFLSFFPVIDGTLEDFLEKMQSIREESQDMKKELSTTIEKYKNELTQSREKAEAKRFQKITYLVGIVVSFFILMLSIVLPIAITKFTVNKSDYPFRKVYEMEIETQHFYTKVDSLLQENRITTDSLIQLHKKIYELEKAINLPQ